MTVIESFPDYSEETVVVSTDLILNDNGTVTIVFNSVPLLDVDELFATMGTEEARNNLADQLIVLVAGKVSDLLGVDSEDLIAALPLITSDLV